MASPIGALRLIAGDRGLAAIQWHDQNPGRTPMRDAVEDANHPVLVEAERQLTEYFCGRRKRFELELDFTGTDFQKRVWTELLDIPFGETRTYGQIAKRLGNEKAMRAVGAANGQNPIPIVAPCHRVIGASGSLVGFGGGLEVKAALLDLERGELSFDFGSNR
jgi:methylated-DNA-[protein]-cysteine S-methyltransferase